MVELLGKKLLVVVEMYFSEISISSRTAVLLKLIVYAGRMDWLFTGYHLIFASFKKLLGNG